MHRSLPPLNALKAFEATARHCHFSKAAEELGVTQGAMSKQVRLLEDYLGIALFERKKGHVTLTEQGQLYYASVTAAFDTLALATDQLAGRKARQETLHINILPSLSTRWLIPLLEDFRKQHPRISVNITLGDGPVQFEHSQIDIAIRSARQNEWKQHHVEKIMGEELLPVCTPALARTLRQPQDIVRHPLLQHTTRPGMWQEYLSKTGHSEIAVEHTLGFEHFFMLIEAAQDGMGIALIPRFLIEKELQDNRLMVAFKAKYKSPYGYYLICPKAKKELRKTILFTRWLMEN